MSNISQYALFRIPIKDGVVPFFVKSDTFGHMNYMTKKEMQYKSEELWFPLSEDILSWDEYFHTLMLNDHIRMTAYEKAIKEVVKQGHVVADIGTGTGILSLWAFEVGAKKVYGIDVNSNMIPKALKRIEKAGFIDKFEVLNGLSYNVNLPERVDVIMSEIMGNLGDNEDMVQILEDARKRFLKKNGIMIPQCVTTYLVPINSTQTHKQIQKKECKGINKNYSLDGLLIKLNIKNQFNLYYDAIIPESCYLSSPQPAQQFNFNGQDETEYKKNLTYTIDKDGIFTGFKGYFIAQLSPGVVLDISGDDIKKNKTSDCWKHCYLPIQHPIKVKHGDELTLTYTRSYSPKKNTIFRQCYSWKGSVLRNGCVIGQFNSGTY